MSLYTLPQHVYLCRTDEGVIILDAKRNRYFGLDHESANSLNTVVVGWPQGELTSTAHRTRTNDVNEAIRQMDRRGLLSTHSPPRSLAPDAPAPATSSCLRDAEVDGPLTPLARLRFLASCAKVRALLSLRTLDAVLCRLESRKAALSGHPVDVSRARHLTHAHIRMRCYVYTAREHCLYDSLVLVEFLASYNLFPDLVIGVATGPFKAHCWVQHDGLVFNEDYDRVRKFTPILVK